MYLSGILIGKNANMMIQCMPLGGKQIDGGRDIGPKNCHECASCMAPQGAAAKLPERRRHSECGLWVGLRGLWSTIVGVQLADRRNLV
eukprot:scaffold6321_cov41-Prasinocladus_malaysianus.AAC.1